MKRRSALIFRLVLMGGLLVVLSHFACTPKDEIAKLRGEPQDVTKPAQLDSGEVESLEKRGDLRIIRNSEFERLYGTPKSSPLRDLEMIVERWSHLALFEKNLTHQLIVDNEGHTSMLTGGNRNRLALIPPDHPRIDAAGRLLDRWDTAIFFHKVSGEKIAPRSAGPDKIMWNGDDIVYEEK